MGEYFFKTSNNWDNYIELLLPYLENVDNPIAIFLSGPTSTGKSSIAIELCHLLGVRNYICTDIMRILLASTEKESLLQYFSHECWKYYGEYTKENLVNAFYKQSEIICSSVELILKDAVRHKKNTIIEGIHLLPSIILKQRGAFPELKMLFVYIMTDFDYLKNELLPNRVTSTYRHRALSDYSEERLLKFKILQEMWKDELIKYNIKAISNLSTPNEIIESVIKKLFEELEGYKKCIY